MLSGSLSPRRIKCAYCDWTTPRFTTTAKGRRVHGDKRLLNHIEAAHPEDYARIMRVVREYREVEDFLEEER